MLAGHRSVEKIKASKQFDLDPTYYMVWNRICEIEKRNYLPYARPLDALELFAFNGLKSDLQDLEHVAEYNIDKIFECCKLLGIPELFIGEHELVSLEVEYGGRIAVWCLVDVIRNKQLTGQCGNSYQYQISGLGGFVPGRYIGKAWDVRNKIEIDKEPFRRYMVMTRREEKNYHGRTNYV